METDIYKLNERVMKLEEYVEDLKNGWEKLPK